MTTNSNSILSRDELFKQTWMHAAKHAAFYRNWCKSNGVDPEEISLDNISKLPITEKDDIQGREADFLCTPETDIVEYVTTSGTMGAPVTFALTDKDVQRLAVNESMALSHAGVTRDDIIQIMVTLDKRFMAGMAYYLGARKIGAAVVRTGVESLEFQIDTIHRIKPTFLIAVPSFVVKLINYAESQGIDINKTSVKRILCIGESIRKPDFSLNTLGQRIVNQWDVALFSTYASTEMATAFTECGHGNGGHHLPELIEVEVLDAEGNQVAPGEVGEIVVTPLGITGMPLIRFRTGDICRLHTETCGCGRSTLRLGPIEGRQKQMIKLKGTSLYPTALIDVMNSASEVSLFVITLRKDELDMDEVVIEYSSDANENALRESLKMKFRSYIRVVPILRHVGLAEVSAKTTNPLARKTIQLIDLR